ncbi:pilus assembly protein PilZ [Ferrimonas sediminicola]|uniref:Pilus assembly protein PilZ n=1 Tax=Ferrimonas sediminicola TaxID=2569538 RepID=A0A4U1BGQ7_9GAMM|nr:PilZ domain-containing protein [Ferrimonas sediminicola]TKB50405.1 pilus assembly protein PilZ [Ferrimonas sediminicola]
MTTSLTHHYASLTELRLAYMAFLKGGGLFVPSEQPNRLGDRVELKVTLPGDAEPQRIIGPVVWLNPQADNQRPMGVGVAFAEGDQALRSRIERLLADTLGSGQLTWTL